MVMVVVMIINCRCSARHCAKDLSVLTDSVVDSLNFIL
jgi:hypothetical protein